MEVFVNGSKKQLGTALTYSPPYQKRKSVNYVCVTDDNIDKITIVFDFDIDNVVIRPLRYETEYKITGKNTVELYLKSRVNVSVEPNGSTDNALLLFCGKADGLDKDNYKHFIYFNKGRHFTDTLQINDDNTLVYIEEGATVDGKIIFKDCRNVAVDGFGTLSYEKYSNRTRLLHFNNCTDVEIRNIVVKDSTNWNVVLSGCKNVHINNIKIIGYHGNSDGIDVCGSKNVTVENCFTRVWDDSLVVKGFDTGDINNIVFKNCVLWNDFARPMEVGVEVRADVASDILFKDIDVIHSMTRYPVMGIHHGDRAFVNNVTFENIVIEDTPGAQLFDLRITHSAWNKDDKMGNIRGVTFKNINVLNNGKNKELPYKSRINGYCEESNICDVVFENIMIGGKYADSLESIGVNVYDYVSNVKVICDGDAKRELIKSSLSTKYKHLKNGYYEVDIITTLTNTSDRKKKGQCNLNVNPVRGFDYDSVINYDIKPYEKTEYKKTIILPPSKYAVSLTSDNFDIDGSIAYLCLDMTLGNDYSVCPPYRFDDGYGNKFDDEMHFALDNDVFKIKSDLITKYDIIFYAAQKPQKRGDGEILFSIEQSNEGKAPAIVNGKNGNAEEAPQIGCPEEIAFVFKNYPKVDIKSIKIHKKTENEAYIKLSSIDIDSKSDFVFEIVLCADCEKRYDFSLFSSPIPKETIREPRVMAHMFANVNVEGER